MFKKIEKAFWATLIILSPIYMFSKAVWDWIFHIEIDDDDWM